VLGDRLGQAEKTRGGALFAHQDRRIELTGGVVECGDEIEIMIEGADPAAAVDQGLKHLVEMPAHLEDQVATVFDLIAGVLIAEPAALLLVEVEREAQAAVDPTLADLAQSPYRPRLGQGVCDLRQACGVGDPRQAISFLGEAQACLARLAGDIFVAVQHHLGGERRMPADLDRQMAPVGSRMWNE
jgi:hypothetical protein